MTIGEEGDIKQSAYQGEGIVIESPF